MSQKEGKKKLVGPWSSIHGAVWLIGLAILAIKGWWWPGILVLIAISGLLEAALRSYAPQAFEEETPTPNTPPKVAAAQPVQPVPSPAPPAYMPSPQDHRAELLPQVCPSCSAPIRGHEVKWTGPGSANCPYCGTNLPMSKA